MRRNITWIKSTNVPTHKKKKKVNLFAYNDKCIIVKKSIIKDTFDIYTYDYCLK